MRNLGESNTILNISETVKFVLRSFRDKIRQWSGTIPKRHPDFIILGATRSGTTYLYHLLQQNPDIFMPPERKELHYFNHNARYRKDLRSYLNMFHGYNNEKYIGEATPMYMEKGLIYNEDGTLDFFNSESAIARIHKHMPNTKLIISLRDPVSRLLSMYKKSYGQGKITKSLKDTILDEFSDKKSFHFIHRNRYDIHLENIFKYFPKDAIQIIVFEEWVQEPQKTFEELCAFIGATPKGIQINVKDLYETSRNNMERYQKRGAGNIEEMTKIDQELECLIKDSFSPVKSYVEDLLGKKVSWV